MPTDIDEKKWLQHETAATRRLVTEVFEMYDDAKLTLEDAKHKIAVIVESTCNRTYDHAFTEGIKAAELDEDADDDGEIDIEFDTHD